MSQICIGNHRRFWDWYFFERQWCFPIQIVSEGSEGTVEAVKIIDILNKHVCNIQGEHSQLWMIQIQWKFH